MSEKIAISIKNVSKTFKLPLERHGSLKSAFLSGLKSRKTYERQEVLKNISFDVKDGEFFGIVGRNGSGKSTLLKLMAGIYNTDKGTIEINGKLTPFIELGVGFNPELTGRENVFLNGALLGFDRKQMEAMYDEIVEFAELEKFMDQKLKNYSSGMQVRLAFSIAIRAKTNILLIDEVLAVGDANFQRKCFEIFKKLKREGNTIVFVSHDVGAVKEYCDRAILLDKGKIVAEGDTDNVMGEYLKLNRISADKELKKINDRSQKNIHGASDKGIKIEKVWVANKDNQDSLVFRPNETIIINVEATAHRAYKNPSIVLRCNNPSGPAVFSVNSHTKKIALDLKPSDKIRIKWEVENIFNDGIYHVSVIILEDEIVQDQVIETHRFDVEGWEYPYSIAHPEDKLEIKKV
ncbi:ABC transporter ATP-binding protein [Candidatus Saccharibacteria bacterium]|nr:ABC transporter ATP-binding protein [Candidatus Saccharibacteria bacterium]